MKTKILATVVLLVLASMAVPAPVDVGNSSAMRTAEEMIEDMVPQEHALILARRPTDDPNLRDDPLFNQRNASTLRPVTRGMQSPAAAQKQRLALAGPTAVAGAKTMRDASAA